MEERELAHVTGSWSHFGKEWPLPATLPPTQEKQDAHPQKEEPSPQQATTKPPRAEGQQVNGADARGRNAAPHAAGWGAADSSAEMPGRPRGSLKRQVSGHTAHQRASAVSGHTAQTGRRERCPEASTPSVRQTLASPHQCTENHRALPLSDSLAQGPFKRALLQSNGCTGRGWAWLGR